MLTIITINLNDSVGLSETIASIEMQDCKDGFAHIIVDGGSVDSSITVLKDYANRTSNVFWVSETDSGIYDAMNKGLTYVNHGYVAFLNAGDVLFNNTFLSDYISTINSNPKIELFYTDLWMVKEDNPIRIWNSGKFSLFKLYFGWMTPHPMTAVSYSSIRSLGCFDTKFSISADYDFMLRRLLNPHSKLLYFQRYSVKMKVGGVSNNSLANIFIANLQVLQSWYKYKPFFALPFWIFLSKPCLKISQYFSK